MKNLLADIDGKSGKSAWRVYTIRHGIEMLEVLVPLKNTVLFETTMKNQHPSKQSVLESLYACGGELK